MKYTVWNLAVPGAILGTVIARTLSEAREFAEQQWPQHAANHGLSVTEYED